LREKLGESSTRDPVASLLSDGDVLSLLASAGMQVETVRTIATPAHYLEELARVREKGYALDDGEQQEGARCVAVALPLEHVRAAISLSAPAVRFPLERVEAVAAALTRVARDRREPRFDAQGRRLWRSPQR
jgi:IclR family acetate operon transcriptional repressor